jgi:hypothetical protein
LIRLKSNNEMLHNSECRILNDLQQQNGGSITDINALFSGEGSSDLLTLIHSLVNVVNRELSRCNSGSNPRSRSIDAHRNENNVAELMRQLADANVEIDR